MQKRASDIEPRTASDEAAAPVVWAHSREGFVGDTCMTLRPPRGHEYTTVSGPHAPHRLNIADVVSPDRDDPGALPGQILTGRSGLSISVSQLSSATPYIWRNVECDELHFLQTGTTDFVTAFG